MTNATAKDRAIALAALLQAVQLVKRVAQTGDADAASLKTLVDSVFRFDAESTEEIYGGCPAIWPGLRALVAQIEGAEGRDGQTTRIAATILHVERRFSSRPAMVSRVHDGLEDIARQREHWGADHPTVLARLGELYAETISHLRPRVLVQGNPAYLGQPQVVAEIRAILLSAIRAAVLWRQMGGSYWDLLLRRRALLAAAKELLGGR
jgi:high frequency lysogenization protein